MASRTVQPITNNQLAIPSQIIWIIDNPQASENYYILERSDMNFHITDVKAIVTQTSGTPDFDFQLKRTRGASTVVITTVNNVDSSLSASTISTSSTNAIIQNAETSGETNGDALFIDPSSVTDVDQVKIELGIIIGVKEPTS